MYTYSYMPPRDAKKASAVVTACFAAGALLVIGAGSLPKLAYVFQIVGIAFLAVGIFLTTRYIIKKYAYSIVKVGDGDYDLVINEISGKKSTVVCRINADEITDFFPCGGALPEKYKKGNGKSIPRFDYCQNMSDENSYYIFAEIREGRVGVRISPDRRLVETIEALMPSERRDTDEEDS